MRRLEGRTAIVTGAGQGIGEAIARRFASEGAKVVIAERDAARGEALAAALRADGATAVSVPTDVADVDNVTHMVEATLAAYGAPDILVNNAGIAVFGEPLDISDADWRRCMSVDLDGAWYCARAVLPHMLERQSGTIINIASVHASQVMRQTFPYPVAKHGLLGLTRALALEYADRGIAVNAISPGYIDTPLNQKLFAENPDLLARAKAEAKHPVKRLGRPDEVAAVAAMLASDEARFIVGANIVIDGGVAIQMYD